MRGAATWLLAGLGLAGCTHYYPVPTAVPVTPEPQNCRQFTRMIVIDGKEVQAVGYACEQPDGTWRVVP